MPSVGRLFDKSFLSFQAVRSERPLGHCGASVLIIAREVDEAADGALALFLLARRDRHLGAATWQSEAEYSGKGWPAPLLRLARAEGTRPRRARAATTSALGALPAPQTATAGAGEARDEVSAWGHIGLGHGHRTGANLTGAELAALGPCHRLVLVKEPLGPPRLLAQLLEGLGLVEVEVL